MTSNIQKLSALQRCPPGETCEDHMCKKTYAFLPIKYVPSQLSTLLLTVFLCLC